jgi:hypothetical protein
MIILPVISGEFRSMSNWSFKPDEISSEVWMGVGGVMLVLLRSIVDGTRRSALQLLGGCIFGGIGAMAAGYVWSGSHYVYLICGVAAVITENIVIGIFNMSQQFANDPKDVFAWAWKLVVPELPFFRSNSTAAGQVGEDETIPAPTVTPVQPGAGEQANG